MAMMWSLILFIGVCSLHWTTGDETERWGCYEATTEITGKFFRKTLTRIEEICYVARRTIIIKNAGLQRIAPHVFDNAEALTFVDLSNNQIEGFTPKLFSKLVNLQKLDLSHNKLTYLNINFEGLNSFKFLDISYNLFWGSEELENLHLPAEAKIKIEGNTPSSPLRDLPGNDKRMATLNQLIAHSTSPA